MEVDRLHKKAVVMDMAFPEEDGTSRRRNPRSWTITKGWKKKWREMWEVKGTVVTAVTGALRAVTSTLGEVLQEKHQRSLSRRGEQ